MTFEKGKSGNPLGRQSKRAKFVQEIVDLFGDNLEKIKKGIQEEIDRNPKKAYLTYMFPLLPKNIELTGEDGKDIGFNLTIEKTYEGKRVEIPDSFVYETNKETN